MALRVVGRPARIDNDEVAISRLFQQLAGFDQEVHVG
jgi:hypothetical protein